MKRGKKLLVLLGVLVVLCAAAWILTCLDLNGTPEEEVDTSVTVMTVDAEQVTALTYANIEKDAMSFTRGDAGWVYDADETFPLDTAVIEDMVSALGEVTAYRTIEEPEEAAQYGLNRPLCTVTVTAGDTVYQLDLGDETSLGGERYASIGDGKVYLVDMALLDAFDYELLDLVQEETLPGLNTVTGLTIQAETQQMKLVYLENSGLAYSDSYVWFLEAGDGYTCLDTQLTEDLVSQLQDLYWLECVNYRADEAALAEYGLDDPMAVIKVDYEGADSLTLEIGSYTADGCCYARIAGSRMVYLIDAALSDAALYTTPDTLLPDEVIAMDFDDLTAVDILLDGETYTVTVETLTETDEEGNTTEKTVYDLNGKQVYLADTLELLEDLTSTGYATGMEPERSQEISFRFHREDENYPVVELSFYRYDSTSCITQLDGTSTVFVSRADVVELIEEVNSVVLE